MEKVRIRRYIDGNTNEVEDSIIDEYTVKIVFENRNSIELITYPLLIEELVIGHLFNLSIINSKDEISAISIINDEKKYNVTVKVNQDYNQKIELASTNRSMKKNDSITNFNSSVILSAMNNFEKLSNLFLTTGAVHVAALAEYIENKNEIRVLYFFEDIGRFNAVDKVIGKAVIDEIDLEEKILLFSGRIFEEIIRKISKTKIRLILSRAAASLSAIELASNRDITVIGFCRENKFNIYN